MRDSLINPFDVRRYLDLWTIAVFDSDGGGDSGGGGGDSGGGGGSSTPSPSPSPSPSSSSTKTLGQVSATGQYAGDGFEWVQNPNTNALTRTYTGAGKDNNLGTDVVIGGTSDNDTKAAVAQISLNEGSAFAASPASATDGNLFTKDFITTGDTGASASFAEQSGKADYTPTITYDPSKTGAQNAAPTAQAKTFSEAFAENRKAGKDTFEWNGGVYTTDLAPEPKVQTQAAPVFYDAFGNEYTTQGAASDADKTMAQQATVANQQVAAAQDAAKEKKLFEQPVVSQSSQDYLDSLGTDWNYGGGDTATDQEPSFSYIPQVDTSAKDADLGVGMSPVTVTADDLAKAASVEGTADATTTRLPSSGGGGVTLANDLANTRYDALLEDIGQTGDVEGEVDRLLGIQAGSEFNPIELDEVVVEPEKETLGQTILNALAANSSLDKAIGTSAMAPYVANVPVGIMNFVSTLGSKAGQTIDQAANTQSNLTLDRMREMGPMSVAQEQALINQAAFEGQQMRDRPLDTSAYDVLSGGFDIAEGMKDYYTKTIPGYEGQESIYKGLKSYEDVVGFEPGQVDRQLLDAMQAQQSGLDQAIFGSGPGSAVRMGGGTGFDTSTAVQKGLEGAGSTTIPLGVSLLGGPVGAVTGAGLGYASVGGELMQQTDQTLQGLYDTGRLQQSDRFKQLAADKGEADALRQMQYEARTMTSIPSAVLGGGATAAEAALLRMGLPGALAVPFIEAAQEGPGETLAANQIVGAVTGFSSPADRREILEAGTAGFGGGVTVGGTMAAAPYIPTGPNVGETAQSRVETAYTAGQQDQQLAGEQLLQQRLEDSIRQTGGVSSDLVEELNAASPDNAASMITDAFNNVETSRGTSMDAIAAQMLVDDLVSQYGNTLKGENETGMGIPPSALDNVIRATGMSMEEVANMIENSTAPVVLGQDLRVDQAQAPADTAGPSRLTLTDAKSVVSTPDLSGIASNLTFQPTAADQAVTSKMDADAAAPLQTAATDQTARVMEVLQNARTQQVAGGPLVSKTGIQSLIDAGLVSEEAANNPMIAQAEVTNLLQLGPEEVKARMGSGVAAEVEGAETTETPVFSTVRNGDSTITPVFESVREGTPAQEEVPARTPLLPEVPEITMEQLVEERNNVIEQNQPQETTQDLTQQQETVTVPIVNQVTPVDDDEFVEVTVDEEETTGPGTGPGTDTDTDMDLVIPPIESVDAEGNTILECPEGYIQVETADGPMCQKSISSERQRAGASTRAYTGLAGNVGRTGPGQKRKTTTSSERIRPTVRSA